MKNSAEKESRKTRKFYSVLEEILTKRGLKKKDVFDETDAVESRILSEYGAVFLVNQSVVPPPVCMFKGEEQVAEFQEKAGIKSANVGGVKLELQPGAMRALLRACK